MVVDKNIVMTASVSETFGISNDALTDFIYNDPRVNRFGTWCGNDKGKIRAVLDTVQQHGIGPVFFAGYEFNEGWNPSWGWLNHTYPQGNYLQDAAAVAEWVKQDAQVRKPLAWIDYANYKDFVPADVKAAGEAAYASWPLGTIGIIYAAGTAAATWAAFYPNGLSAAYNGVQNYGDPFASLVDTINALGGSVGGTKPKPPTQNPSNKPSTKPKPTTPTKPKDPELILKNGRIQMVGRTLKVMGQNATFMQSGPGEWLITSAKTEANSTPQKPKPSDKDQANQNKPAKPKPPASSLKPVSDIAGLIGTTVGSGQCYALASWWAQHNGTPPLVPGSSHVNNTQWQPYPEQPIGWAAANIGGDYQWDEWGWDVLYNVRWEDARAGDIACMGTGTYAQTARIGHVVVIKDNVNGNVGFYEQNGAYGQIVAETGNPRFPYLKGMTSTYNYWDCSPKILIRKR
nr:MAG TPA: Lysin [Caudoviricetes sp.]